MVMIKLTVKSLARMFVFLLFITHLPLVMSLRNELQIQNVQISLAQDFSILPEQNTKDSLCNEDFVGNVYAQLALTQLQIFKDPTNFRNIDHYREQLIIMYNQTLELSEQLASYINLKIQPKPLISPTYFPYYQTNNKGERIYQPYQEVDVMSQSFMQRLQKDKELYVFIKRTETITKNTSLLQQNVVQQQKKYFLTYFPDYYWIGQAYVPELFGLQTSEEVLDKLEQFSVARYRFWNVRMYRSIQSDNIKQADVLMNYLEKITNDQIDDEIRIFACDLYAALLFEFQCLLNLDISSQDELIQQNFSLFRIIEEKFYTDQNIGSIPACQVAISPQEHFIKNIIGLNFNFNFTREDYENIGMLLNSGLMDDFTSDFYEIAKYFFEFDIFVIDFLLNKLDFHHLNMNEMKTIQQMFLTFKKNTGASNEQLDIIYYITIHFLRYLVMIQNSSDINQRFMSEGIKENIKFQYLIFTYIRINLIKTGDTSAFLSWENFIQYYITIYNRQLKTGADDELIYFVGEERYYSVILITIEIITYVLLNNDQNYLTQVYETMGDTIQHGSLTYFIENRISTILQEYINKYKLITDDDFIAPRIIQRIYLEDRVEDMLTFLNDKRERKNDNFEIDQQEIDEFEKSSGKNKKMTNFDHLIEKRSFYKTLVQIIYNQQESSDNNDFKNRIKKIVTDYKLSDSKKIVQQIDSSQIDFVERQKQVYYHIYLYALYEVQLLIDRQPQTDAFLSFLELYKEEDDAKFSRSENTDIPEEELRTINFVFMNKIVEETVDYDDKWNEIIFMDAMFLYPFLYVKHREQQFGADSNTCENYDPVIMTLEEAEFKQIQGQQLQQITDQQTTQCVQQRQESFGNLLLDEDILEGSEMTQNDFVQHLILSPEMYLQIEQFEFMVDAFQLFNIFKKVNGQRLMTDNVLNDIFFSLYRFIIQIRGDPNFIYDFDFWGTINSYIERCMMYQRFGTRQDKKYYYCSYGYQRYNEMYWFIKDAQYKFTGDFEIMRQVLLVDRSSDYQSINWGDRTHGRFDYFTHYLVKVKTFNNYSNQNQDMVVFNEENNWKNEFWDECSFYAQQESNIDYCKFLYKVGQLLDQLDGDLQVQDKQYDAIVSILLDNLYSENDKIIAWEVLDFFQFESEFTQDETIEKIREIFDSEMIQKMKSQIKNNSSVVTLSTLLDIQNTQLIGQYGMSKYNQNTTIKNMSEIQYGLQDSKKNFALHNLINDNVLNSEKNIFDFLSLQQSETHNAKFKGYKLVHHLPLSLLLFYADEEVEFTRIANVLKQTGNLEMMFLGNVKAGEMIIEHFGVYIKKKFKNETKDSNKYTMKNLETFITGIEKQVSKNRTVKDLSGLKTKTEGQQLNVSFMSGVSDTRMSLKSTPKKIQNETVQVVTSKVKIQPVEIQVIEKEVDPNVRVISDTINQKEVQELPIQDTIIIKRESIQTDLKDQVLDMGSSKQNFQFTKINLTQDLDSVNNLTSIQSQKNEIIDMENQDSRIAVISKVELKSNEPITEQKIVNNVSVEKKTVTQFKVTRKKKETIAVQAKTPQLFFNDDRRII